MADRRSIFEPRTVRAGVASALPPNPNEPSKTKAGVLTSPSGEHELDAFIEKGTSPNWLPCFASLPGLRAVSRYGMPPASRSKCHTTKEAMPVRTGRTDVPSPANDVAQKSTLCSLLRKGEDAYVTREGGCAPKGVKRTA